MQSNAGPASLLRLSLPEGATAGQSFSVTASALTLSGNPAATFTGTIHFTSSDAQAILPTDYTFAPLDAGVHLFSVTLKTSGSQTVSVTDTGNDSLTVSQTESVAAASASVISATAGSGQTAVVSTAFATALQAKVNDAFGNGVPGVSVIFAAPVGGASGTFEGGGASATVQTGQTGLAVAPAFTANATAGAFSVTAASVDFESRGVHFDEQRAAGLYGDGESGFIDDRAGTIGKHRADIYACGRICGNGQLELRRVAGECGVCVCAGVGGDDRE